MLSEDHQHLAVVLMEAAMVSAGGGIQRGTGECNCGAKGSTTVMPQEVPAMMSALLEGGPSTGRADWSLKTVSGTARRLAVQHKQSMVVLRAMGSGCGAKGDSWHTR